MHTGYNVTSHHSINMRQFIIIAFLLCIQTHVTVSAYRYIQPIKSRFQHLSQYGTNTYGTNPYGGYPYGSYPYGTTLAPTTLTGWPVEPPGFTFNTSASCTQQNPTYLSCNISCYIPTQYCCYNNALGQANDTVKSCPGYIVPVGVVISSIAPTTAVSGTIPPTTGTMPPTTAVVTSMPTTTIVATNTPIISGTVIIVVILEVTTQLSLSSGCSAFTADATLFEQTFINELSLATGADVTQFNLTGIVCSQTLQSLPHKQHHLMSANDGINVGMTIQPQLDAQGNIVPNTLSAVSVIQLIQSQQQTPGSALLSSNLLSGMQPVQYSTSDVQITLPATNVSSTTAPASTSNAYSTGSIGGIAVAAAVVLLSW